MPAAIFTCLSSTSSQYLIASQCHCFTVRLRFWIPCLPQNNTASASPSLDNHCHSKLQHTFLVPHTLLLYVCRSLDSRGSSSAILRGAAHKLQHVLNQPNSTGLTELWMKSSAEGISCVPDPHLLFLPMKRVVSEVQFRYLQKDGFLAVWRRWSHEFLALCSERSEGTLTTNEPFCFKILVCWKIMTCLTFTTHFLQRTCICIEIFHHSCLM